MRYSKILLAANKYFQLVKLAGIECYHVSTSDFEVGKTYTFNSSMMGTQNPLKDDRLNIILEKVRLEKFPDKPSRYNSFFCSPFKRSHWLNPGKSQYLYRVEAMEPYHIGDIEHINLMVRYPHLAEDEAIAYWEGKSQAYYSDTEIITPAIKILEKNNNPLVERFFRLKKDLIASRPQESILVKDMVDNNFLIKLTTHYDISSSYDNKKVIFTEHPKVRCKIYVVNESGEFVKLIPDFRDFLDNEKILLKDIFSKKFEYVEPVIRE